MATEPTRTVERRLEEWFLSLDVYRSIPRWRWRKRREQMLRIKQREDALDAR